VSLELSIPKQDGFGGTHSNWIRGNSLKFTSPKTKHKTQAEAEGKKKSDFGLIGCGEKGSYCGVNRMNKLCNCGESFMFSPLSCKRIECPECSSYWMIKKTKRIAFRIESYARSRNERPHAIVISVNPQDGKDWAWKEFRMSLFRRGYRRAKALGVNGGCAIFHAFRIKKNIKTELRKKGLKNNYWKAVRDDALGLGSWKEYVQFGPHQHSIGFPSFLKEHKSTDFLIKKYATLKNLESVVRHVLYLIGHSTIYKEGVNKGKDTIKWWGDLNKRTKHAFNEEVELSDEDREKLKIDIEDVVDKIMNGEEGKSNEITKCPKCGLGIDHFFKIEELNTLLRNKDWRNGVASKENLKALDKLGELLSIKADIRKRRLKKKKTKKLSPKEEVELNNIFLDEAVECLKNINHNIIFFSRKGIGIPQ